MPRRIPLPLVAALALASALVLAARTAAAEERILDFDSLVEVGGDGVLTVTETIRVRAEGRSIRRGIYRDFPTTYARPGIGKHKVGFKVIEILRDGQRENWFTESLANGVRVYVGRKSVYLDPGIYTYTLIYRTDRQIGFFDDFDELYWNVTGNDWEFPIERATATILLPPGAPIIQGAGYTGRQGAQGRDWVMTTDARGRPRFETTRVLAPREGLTVAVAWPKGYVDQPDEIEQLRWWIRDFLPAAAAVAAVLLVLGYYLLAWHRVGRDPPGSTIIPRWRPPKGVSPAASRFLTRMDFDRKAIGAAIISLAVKGRLIIEDEGSDEYTLRRRQQVAGPPLSRGEKALEKALFLWDNVASVRNGNHARLQPAVAALRAALSDDFDGMHFVRNFGFVVFGVILSFLAAFGVAVLSANDTDLVAGLSMLLTIAMLAGLNVLFVRLIRAPTEVGRGVLDEIEGFRMYLSTAERERLNLLHPPDRTPELFEKYLPYAMALDVEHEWAEQFQDVLAAATSGDDGDGWQPGWYRGHGGWHYGRSPGRFASNIGSALGGAIAAAATPPGSSSGSGGGGSSGGGGGGGGGGGW